MVKYVVKTAAYADMAEIVSYLVSKYAKSAAERLKIKFKDEFERLALFPLSGATVKSKRFNRFRFSIVEKYYVFYTFDGKILTIERVLHTARNYKNILKNGLSV